LGTLLSANAIQAAPVGLAGSAATAALLGASPWTIALVKGTLKTLTWIKLKLGLAATLGLIAITAIVVAISNTRGREDSRRRATDWELHGALVLSDYTTQDGKPTQDQYEFRVWRMKGLWKIRVTPVPSRASWSVSEYMVLGTDGTNTFRVSAFNPAFDQTAVMRKGIQIADRQLADGSKIPEELRAELLRIKVEYERQLTAEERLADSVNKAIGGVRSVLYPEYHPGDYTAMLWLAYCSEGFFDEYGKQRAPYISWSDGPPDSTTNYLATARVSRMPDRPHLPSEVAFLHAGSYIEPTASGRIPKPLGPPFAEGYTNVLFRVTAVTNLDGVIFPRDFSVGVYGLSRGPSGERTIGLLTRIEATTTAIRTPCSIKEFVPRLTEPTLIQDGRVSLQYLAQPGSWPSTSDPWQLQSFEREIRAKHRQ
jgi:hypothetical protein